MQYLRVTTEEATELYGVTILKNGEKTILLSDFGRQLPDKRKYEAILRWTTHGRTGVRGKRIKLERVQTPGGWATSLEAYQRFLERLNK